MLRHKARAVVLAALFQWDLAGQDLEQATADCVNDFGLGEAAAKFAQGLVKLVRDRQGEIDRIISNLAVDWRLERMATVDRNILRIGIAEMLFSDVPFSVAINEAVELAKEYSTEEAARFINGVLGELARRTPPKT